MKKLFCIESDWDCSPKKEKTILPLLECIKGVYPEFEYIYRTANTEDELIYCLKKFKTIRKCSTDFYTIVFCGHGKTGKLTIGDERNSTELTLKKLAELCESVDTQLFSGQHVHFDSCSVLRTTDARLSQFLESTGAVAISGFSKKVDFIMSYALEMILFESLITSKKIMSALKRFESKNSELCMINEFKVFNGVN